MQLNFRNFRNFAISVSQCFAKFRKSCFAVLRLFLKIRKVSQIRVFASFHKYKFRKVSQIGFSFRKVSQVSQGFCNGQFADAVYIFKHIFLFYNHKVLYKAYPNLSFQMARLKVLDL